MSLNKIKFENCQVKKAIVSSNSLDSEVDLRKCIQCDDARRLRDGKIQRAKLKGIYLDKNLQEINNLDKFMKVGI